MRVPYVRQIATAKDIIALERDMRGLLQCQGRSCAFLQSAEYAALKISMYHALRELPPSTDMRTMAGQTIYIPGSTLFIEVGEDGLRLLIQSKTTALAPATKASSADTAVRLQMEAHTHRPGAPRAIAALPQAPCDDVSSSTSSSSSRRAMPPPSSPPPPLRPVPRGKRQRTTTTTAAAEQRPPQPPSSSSSSVSQGDGGGATAFYYFPTHAQTLPSCLPAWRMA